MGGLLDGDAGGGGGWDYTTLVDMPLNCLPETTTVEALEEKRRAAARASALWTGRRGAGWWVGARMEAGRGMRRTILPLARRGCRGLSASWCTRGVRVFG